MQCLILSGVTVLLDLAACRRERLSVNLIFAANAFGFAQQVPSEQVASVLMPTSPPSTLPPSTSLVALLLTVSVATSISSSVATSVATEGMSPVGASSSTSTDTNQRPALTDRRLRDALVGGETIMLLQTHDADARQLDASIQHLDGSAASAQSVLAGLALGKFHPQPLAVPLFADVTVVNQLSTPAWRLRSAS